MHYRSRGRLNLPVVIRVPYGGGIGAVEHHSESPEALFAHTAGLRVVSPSTPADGVHDDPAGHRLAGPGAVLRAQGPLLGQGRGRPGRRASTPPHPGARHAPGSLRAGTDVTLVAYGPTVRPRSRPPRPPPPRARSVEVVDLRTLSPARHRDGRRVGEADRPVRRRARGPRALRHRRRGRRARSPRSASTTSRRPCCGSAASTRPYPVAKIEHDYLPGLDRVLDAVDRVAGLLRRPPCRPSSSSRSPTPARA